MPSSPASPAAQAPPKDWTVLEVLRWTSARFGERGLDSPRLDAELLLAHALGWRRIELYVHADKLLTADELAAVRALIVRRQGGESVAYIVGHKEFWGLDLVVDARVLVPRPDTETLVQAVLDRLPAPSAEASAPRVLDVGTGSGAIALALAKQRPDVVMHATDASAGALEVARGNAERLALPVRFLGPGDLLEPVRGEEPFAVIVANLPYIPTRELAGLPPEVRSEPRLALDGGADGLELVRRLVREAPPLLRQGGALALEIGAGQAHATAALLQGAGFTDVRTHNDLGGIERCVSGVRTPPSGARSP